MFKRTFDCACAAIGLLVLSPLLLVLAIGVKLDSRGPILFRQQRVGRNGALFDILKFRSMVAGAERLGPAVTAAGDARVTRLGAWLRATKLDELPQLINVLRGDMSMVGPRPEVPQFIELYTDEQRAKVLSCRPGITDPASIRFSDESALLSQAADPVAAYRDLILPQKINIYMQYVETRSLAGDVRILLATFVKLLSRRQRSV